MAIFDRVLRRITRSGGQGRLPRPTTLSMTTTSATDTAELERRLEAYLLIARKIRRSH